MSHFWMSFYIYRSNSKVGSFSTQQEQITLKCDIAHEIWNECQDKIMIMWCCLHGILMKKNHVWFCFEVSTHFRNKPIRYGFKIWTHNLANGYLINFDPYCGKCSNSFTQKYSDEFTLPNSVILGFADFIPAGSQLYFDNYFSSVALMDELSHRNILAIGTRRENMIMKCPVLPKGKMKKQPRGRFEIFHDANGGSNYLIRWLDNAVVTQISNFDNAEPVGQERRWSSTLKKTISVDIPHSVQQYNKYMGDDDDDECPPGPR